jgi:hypothetical protein
MRRSSVGWLGVALVLVTGCSGANNEPRVRATQAQLQALTTALRAYRVARGDYPDDLQALADTAEAMPAYVDRSALLDPWGRPYHYEPHIRHPTDGTPLVYSDGPTPGDAGKRIRNWADAAPAQPDTDLKFAQAVVEEFLGHALRGNTRAALAMGTPAFEQRWGFEPGHGTNPLRLTELQATVSGKYSTWQMSSSTLSTGGDGAVFTGNFQTVQGGQSGFTLRLVKEKTGGPWKVDGLDVREASRGR